MEKYGTYMEKQSEGESIKLNTFSKEIQIDENLKSQGTIMEKLNGDEIELESSNTLMFRQPTQNTNMMSKVSSAPSKSAPERTISLRLALERDTTSVP